MDFEKLTLEKRHENWQDFVQHAKKMHSRCPCRDFMIGTAIPGKYFGWAITHTPNYTHTHTYLPTYIHTPNKKRDTKRERERERDLEKKCVRKPTLRAEIITLVIQKQLRV